MEPVYYRNIGNPGFGNLALQLSMIYGNVKYVHKSILDFEFSNCIELHGFTIVDTEGAPQPHVPVYINQTNFTGIHTLMRDILKPTEYMKGLISAELHILEGVSSAVNIRRGSYCHDSTMYADDRAKTANHYFCSEKGLEKFKQIIQSEPGKVYVASDSSSTKKELKELFGSKVVMHETQYAHTAPQTLWSENQTVKNLQDVYLVWFIMSMCPKIFITAGSPELVGFSTYGYAAAVYGNKVCLLVLND